MVKEFYTLLLRHQVGTCVASLYCEGDNSWGAGLLRIRSHHAEDFVEGPELGSNPDSDPAPVFGLMGRKSTRLPSDQEACCLKVSYRPPKDMLSKHQPKQNNDPPSSRPELRKLMML